MNQPQRHRIGCGPFLFGVGVYALCRLLGANVWLALVITLCFLPATVVVLSVAVRVGRWVDRQRWYQAIERRCYRRRVTRQARAAAIARERLRAHREINRNSEGR